MPFWLVKFSVSPAMKPVPIDHRRAGQLAAAVDVAHASRPLSSATAAPPPVKVAVAAGRHGRRDVHVRRACWSRRAASVDRRCRR